MRRSLEIAEAVERRRRILRTVLFLIIVGTFPFYCLGFWLWGTAPKSGEADQSVTPRATFTPIGNDVTGTRTLIPSITPLGLRTVTPFNPLPPTPGQFFPPAISTRFLSPTPFPTIFIPVFTAAPTLTFPPAPTDVPPPTDPPPPTSPPIPSDTPLPPPTDTPLPPPSDTPVPVAAEVTAQP
jgi:hypothetical protein